MITALQGLGIIIGGALTIMCLVYIDWQVNGKR
jgi:hypothetical protein